MSLARSALAQSSISARIWASSVAPAVSVVISILASRSQPSVWPYVPLPLSVRASTHRRNRPLRALGEFRFQLRREEGITGFTSLASRDRAHDKERLRTGRDRFGQRRIRWFMRNIFPANEEPHQRSSLLCNVVADGAAQSWIVRLE